MDKELFIKYAEIKNQIKSLKEQEDEISKQVMEQMENDGVVKAQSDFGTFSLIQRKTYKFTEEAQAKIDKDKADLKEMEKEFIEEGLAEEQITNSLRYQNAKN